MNGVKLIWYTPDAEILVAYMAGVSNPENQDKKSRSQIRGSGDNR